MKAVIIERYGAPSELKIAELPVPACKPTDVLIRNEVTTVNPWDWKVRNGSMKLFTGRKFPKILGTESAGTVEHIGDQVRAFKKGDRVIALTGVDVGSYAEYVAVPASRVARMPEGLSFAQAATLPVAASTAYNALLGLGKLQRGGRVLVNGASGAVGSFAVQIAKLLGARVTAVCSTPNVAAVRAMGADEVVDYTTTDIAGHPGRYDVVFDAVNTLRFGQVHKLLVDHGVMIGTLPTPGALLTQWLSSFRNKKFKAINNRATPANIELLASWVQAGKLTAVIDRTYSMSQLPEAHQYSETGRAKGKILISLR